MRIWKKAFKTWKNTCPHIKRELFTKDEFVRWADDLKLIHAFDKHDFYTFLVILEECEIICPMAFANLNQGRVYLPEHVVSQPNTSMNTSYYHPIHFIEVLNWFRRRSLKRSPYFSNKPYRDFFSLKLLERRISNIMSQIEIFKNRESNHSEIIDSMNEKLSETEEEWIEHPLYGNDLPSGDDLLRDLKIGWTRNIFSEEKLCIWIKIESLLLQEDAHIFAKRPPQMRLRLDFFDYFGNKEKIRKEIMKYREWRNGIIEDKAVYLNETEIKDLKDLHRGIKGKISDGDYGSFGSRGNWNDLFDVIPSSKKDKLLGMTSYFVNLLSLKRYLERAYWELFERNITSGQETKIRPYFVFDTPDQFMQYLESILLQFGLYKTIPFVLFVEGMTEETILEEYLQNSDSPKFRIEKTQGITNMPYYLQISESIKDWYTYAFLDYDNYEKYQKIKEAVKDKGSFFFPDFVTENFSVTQYMNSFLDFSREIDLELPPDFKIKIENQLMNEKNKSDAIIQDVKKRKEISTLGFEKYTINQLKRYYSKEIALTYSPQIVLDHNGYIQNSRRFEDIYKTEIANRLKIYVLESLKEDKKRRFKFPFEQKLESFQGKILAAVYRVPFSIT